MQVLGRKGRKKWKHSSPQGHLMRLEIEELYEAGIFDDLDKQDWWSWHKDKAEHLKQCRHCRLIVEDVHRKAMAKWEAKMHEEARKRQLHIDSRYTGCLE